MWNSYILNNIRILILSRKPNKLEQQKDLLKRNKCQVISHRYVIIDYYYLSLHW